MAIQFKCEHCGRDYNVSVKHAGRKAKCKSCSQPMLVPAPAAAKTETPEPEALSRNAPAQEVSEGGSVIYRHENRERDFELAVGGDNLDAITAHIERHLGDPATVFHELVSDLVHVDVHWIKPTAEKPFHCLVTSGMSDRPMIGPEGEEFFSELVCFLPPEWPVGKEEPEDQNNFYWPIYWLKYLARFPHEYQTWLWTGHTIPNGDPPSPLGDNTSLTGWLIYPSLIGGDEFVELELSAEKSIFFFAIIPVYEDEMNFKLKQGTDELLQLFDQHEIMPELIDIRRPCVCKKKRGLWPFSRN